MITSSFSADEIRAAAETHRELPPEYQTAVIDSFLSKVDREIDARVDARMASYGPARTRSGAHSPAFFVLATLIFGIPLSAIAVAAGQHPAGFLGACSSCGSASWLSTWPTSAATGRRAHPANSARQAAHRTARPRATRPADRQAAGPGQLVLDFEAMTTPRHRVIRRSGTSSDVRA